MQSNNNSQDNQAQEQAHLSQEVFKAAQEKFLHLNYSVFKLNPEGAELLATLKDSLIDRSPVANPEKSESHAFYREGQNSIIRSFMQNILAYEKLMKENANKTEAAQ